VLILVRHGRTALNAQGRLQGRSDHPLDDLGLQQAREAVTAIGPVDRVIASPLQRAQETAAQFGMPVETDHRWVEYHYGSLEGTLITDVPPDIWELWKTDGSYAPPGGESYDELHARVLGACDELVGEIRTKRVVVVSHVSPIKAAIGWVLGLPPTAGRRYHLDVASISRISYGTHGPVLRSYNETWHLSSNVSAARTM